MRRLVSDVTFSLPWAVLACLLAVSGCDRWAPGQRAAVAPLTRLRRLSNREYNNVVRDLLGDETRPADKFILDAYPNGYDNGSAGLAVQSDQVVAYQSAAETLAANAVANNFSMLVPGCEAETQGSAACVDVFLNGFVARAWRRPLTETEAEQLRSIIQSRSQNTADFRGGIQSAVEVALQSPQFLYREELGAPNTPNSGRTIRLTDYEVAQELSFLLTGSIPDAQLWEAVQHGRFRTLADRRREAKRLLATPGAKATLRAFLHQWLATNRLATLTKDQRFYPDFSPALAASMSTELDGFFDKVMWRGKGSLRELFTSNQSIVDGALAQLYGIPAPGPGFQQVSLDSRIRKGVLTRAGFLAVHSDTDSSGPITRGVFLLDTILCAPPPPPPPNVPPPKPPDDPSAQELTTRQRFDQHVSSAACAGCHRQIDGVGFGFEQFDAIGSYRTTENGQPVDSSGELIGTKEDGPFNGASALALKLSGSQQLSSCFARQVYRYAMGEIEFNDDSLEWLKKGFTTDSRITDVLMTLVESPAFVSRNLEGSSP